MGVVTLAGLTDAGDDIRIAVNDQGQLVVETAAAPLALQAHDRLNTIIELLTDIKAALEANS